MRVLINALGADTGGAATHLTHFLPALAKLKGQFEYWVLCRNKFINSQSIEGIHFIGKSDRLASSSIYRFLYDNLAIPQLIKQFQIDKMVSLTNFGTISPSVPHVVFERNPLYFSVWYRGTAQGNTKIQNNLRANLTWLIMRNATTVVTPSQSMALMIQETFPDLKPSKFKTLYHGFEFETAQDNSRDELKAALTSIDFKIVYPTLPAFHKGIFILFDVVRHLQKAKLTNFRLYLTFSENEAKASFGHFPLPDDWTKLCGNIVFLGKQPHSKMSCLYQHCDVMIYPSLSESFGFSMLEAMAYGLPIVALDTPINREMCEDAALYFSPKKPQQAVEHILSIQRQSQLKNELLNNSKKRFQSFDWSWDRYCRDFQLILQGTN